MRTLKGRKNSKKRNHINYFLTEYDGRFEYRLLGKEDFDDCRALLDEWTINKEENDNIEEGVDDERSGIE